MARTLLDLLLLGAVFAVLYGYERLRVRNHRDAALRQQRRTQQQVFEDAEWEAVLRMRRPELQSPMDERRFAVAANRAGEATVGAMAGTAANAAEE